MKHRSIAALALLSGVSLQATEGLGQLQPGAAVTDLLGGRLTIRLPHGAHIAPMAHSLMSAPEAGTEQTRIVLDAGPQRMVIMTYELFRLASKDIENRLSEGFTKNQIKVNRRSWALSPPLRAYAFFPQSPTQKENANFVMGLYLIRSDSTIQQLDVYVNPEGVRDFANVSKLAEAICATITEGKRSMNTARGDRELLTLFEERPAMITVPEGYVVTLQRGDDFVVYHSRKLVKWGDPSANIGVYFGDFPSRHEGYSRKEGGRLFGKNVDWYEKITKEDGDSYVSDDALVSLGPERPHFADVFLSAEDAAVMQELKKTAATLRIRERSKR